MSQPITRKEQYLSAMANGNSTDIKPVTREEMYLAKATGQSVAIPEPVTRKEVFLRDIALNGSGGGSVILKPFTLTEGGTYRANDYGADGFSSVFADVDPAPIWDESFTITGDPDDEGGTCDSPLAYHLTSASELPDDAVDGSLAVVEYGESITKTVGATAIPVGEPVERIYFNTNLSVEETNAYLSQLTYVDIGLGAPIYPIFVNSVGNFFVYATKTSDEYFICAVENFEMSTGRDVIYQSSNYNAKNNGYHIYSGIAEFTSSAFLISGEYSVSDFNGIPVGAENEKIKNVLSITPVNQISYSKALYSRQNGEWVNKGEL